MPSSSENEPLLFYCAKGRHYVLFQRICVTRCLPQKYIIQSINLEKSPLCIITDDASMCKILNCIGGLSPLTTETKQQVFNTICKHNLHKTLELFQYSLSTKEINSYAKCKDAKGVSALLMAAISSSDKVLLTLISSIFLSELCPREEKDQHLHDKDQNGRTLMNIVIAHGESLTFAKELLLKIGNVHL